MIRLVCVLSAPVSSGKVKHYQVRAGSGLSEKQEMPPPRLLVIEADEDTPGTGALLYRFNGKGECVADTWHESVAVAKEYANAEYEGAAQTWQELPAGVGVEALETADFGASVRGIR
jgi:hypothetical protein